MKEKKSGFTLVELLVAIAIMGILLMIAIPQIIKLKDDYRNKKYETYKESIERAAKLYTDSNSKDMYGYQNSGCYTIDYSILKNANLIKDFEEKDITCSNDDDTYVNVVKAGDEYMYVTNIRCYKTGKTSPVYEDVKEEKNSCKPAGDTTSPIITVNTIPAWTQHKNAKVKITIEDKSSKDEVNVGLNKNISIEYVWQKNGVNVGNWKLLDFSNKEIGKKKITKEIKSKDLPQESDEYTLVIKPVNVKDAVGNSVTENQMFSPFRFDSIKPVLTLEKNGSKLTYGVTDIPAGINSYYFGTKNCKNDNSVYISGNAFSITKTITDGRKYYLCAKDHAGNVSEKEITAYKKCDKTKDSSWQNVGTCSKSCGSGEQKQENKVYDYYTNEYCSTKTRDVNCNTQDCCSKTYVKYGDWSSYSKCTKSCGTGTKTRTRKMYYYSSYNNKKCDEKIKKDEQKCNTDPCFTATVSGKWQCGSCKDTCSDAQVCHDDIIGNVVAHVWKESIVENGDNFKITLNYHIFQGKDTWIAKGHYVDIECPDCSSNKKKTLKSKNGAAWTKGSDHSGTYTVKVPKKKASYKIKLSGDTSSPSFNMSFGNVITVK